MSGRSPAESWLVCRLDDPVQLRLAINQYDNWDIFVRIDGGYSLEDAHRVIESHRAEITELVAEALRKWRGGEAA